MKTNASPACWLLKLVTVLITQLLINSNAWSQVPVNDTYLAPTLLTSGVTCVNTAGTVNNSTATAGDVALCSPTGYDVWYTFIAQSQHPSIQITSPGAGWTGRNVQVLEGSFGTLISRYCGNLTNVAIYPYTLTIGATYYIRVYSTNLTAPVATGNFNICITDVPAGTPPVNDASINAINVVSQVGCVNTTYNIGNATYNASEGGVACSGTDRFDVWFMFTAQSLHPTITVSGNTGAVFNNPRIQIFTGTPGSLVSIGCSGSASYTLTTAVIGQTYYYRVYSASGTLNPNNSIFGNFNMCISDPVTPFPNDNCGTPTVLVQGAVGTCAAVTGNLTYATPAGSAIPGDCGDPASPDLWYSFVATTAYPEIRLTGIGAQLAAAGLRVQVFTGTCGTLTSLVCQQAYGATSVTTGPTNNPYIPGTTYFVRIYSNGSTITSGTWNFSICVSTTIDPNIHYGKTYANVTKGSGGGTIEPNDELEIRAILNIKAGAMFNSVFLDTIPANTSYIPGTLRILTNEGKIFRQWTDAVDSDPADITGDNIKINLGNQANVSTGGSIRNTDRPTLSSGCIMMISYKIRVNAVAFNTNLQLGSGTVTYGIASGATSVIHYAPIRATVYQNYGICTNTIGTNGILSEFGGTFGSGIFKNREASNKVPANYVYATFKTGAPGDYFYGVSNNTSSDSLTNYSISTNEPIPSLKRVFTFWDVIGDHTGASDPLAGNPPADVNNSATGGYMVVINAAYRADTAFQDTVRNLCPNTSYEYAAWFRNICKNCGVDSTGIQAMAAGYRPTGPGDSSGVHPNLTFNINGYDYYTTGDMGYTGQWVKKGFTYRTGPGETEMVINIRNNAPGGGGNDWAIDDIGVATCSPTLLTNPDSSTVRICYGDGRALSAEVISYYDNYTHWIWEKSVDSGAVWTATSYEGIATPALISGNYEYTATGPAVPGDSASHRSQYRLRVATSADNLSDINCSFRAIRNIEIMVANCMHVLKTKVNTLSGRLLNNYGTLSWSSTGEENGVVYIVEKSTDGSNYSAIATVIGKAVAGLSEKYNFNDPDMLKSAAYYRVQIKEAKGQEYTRVILLSPSKLEFEIKNIINPFYQQVHFDIITPAEGNTRITVMDHFGRIVKTYSEHVNAGITPVTIANFGALSTGMYSLKVEYGNKTIIKRIIKAEN